MAIWAALPNPVKVAILVGGLALVAVVAAFVLPGLGDQERQGARPLSKTVFDTAPHEYLYLDNERVLAYLSQTEGGLSEQQKLSRSATDRTTGELSAGPIAKAGRERQSQEFVEEVVTPTATSRFYRLVGLLRERGEIHSLPRPETRYVPARSDGVESRGGFRSLNLETFLREWKKVREGDFVTLASVVEVPSFVRLYRRLRQAPRRSRLARRGMPAVKAAGVNPRFPFVMQFREPGRDDEPRLTILLPSQYGAVAAESSLFYGTLTVVGKVVYRVGQHQPSYVDHQTYNTFSSAVRATPDRMLNRLRLPRTRLKEELLNLRRLGRNGAVVVPVAIYK
jgi:hypothetical protein